MKAGSPSTIVMFAALLSASPSLGANENSVAINEQIGAWKVLGDPGVGACVAFTNETTGTKLTIASLGARDTLRFAISNPAWRSLKDDDHFRIRASFVNKAGKITDGWDLASVSTSANAGGPRIHFDISRAANDNTSFIEQFQKAHSLWFWNGGVYVAKFDLKDSSAMIESLLNCRVKLQLDENFDPFAG